MAARSLIWLPEPPGDALRGSGFRAKIPDVLDRAGSLPGWLQHRLDRHPKPRRSAVDLAEAVHEVASRIGERDQAHHDRWHQGIAVDVLVNNGIARQRPFQRNRNPLVQSRQAALAVKPSR